MTYRWAVAIVFLAALCGCGSALDAARSNSSNDTMVVTANPHATRAGLEVLRRGGSAVDAAVAIQAVLSLVEPQSSGLAGGAYMLHYTAESQSLTAYDGRETAPASAAADLFINADGKALGFIEAKNSGLSTGVPGVVAMLSMAHGDHGRLPWQSLFGDASSLAQNGFEISPRLHRMITYFARFIPNTIEQGPIDAFEYFFDDTGAPLPVGHVLKNPDYAETLSIIATDPEQFYHGSIASDIVAMVQRSPRPGGLGKDDMAAYTPIKHKALCKGYRDVQLCGPPPASSWIAVAMIMGLLDNSAGFSSDGASDPENWALLADAQRLAYADRDHYIADAAYVNVPVQGLLNDDYLTRRASMLSSGRAISKVTHGDPWPYQKTPRTAFGNDQTQDTPGTTHFVVVDQQGDVVSMTASVESIFGSTRMVGGMFLNNQLTDFSFAAVDEKGQPVANAAAAGKRPRSSMSPTIVLDNQGDFLMATGSPGGNNIIAYVVKTLVGVLDWGLTAQAAVDLPNMVARGDVVRLERERASPELVSDLEEMGFSVNARGGENSGLGVVVRTDGGRLQGGVDPRREGVIGTLRD